jgi:hypothetical protein
MGAQNTKMGLGNFQNSYVNRIWKRENRVLNDLKQYHTM